MRIIKRFVRDVFGFSRTEINGFMILLPLTILVVISLPVYKRLQASEPDFSSDIRQLDSLTAILKSYSSNKRQKVVSDSARVNKNPEALFTFNPNTATVDELKMLGFTDHLSTRIASYRFKGGQFRVKSDLLKIYGIDTSFYHRLYPFIQLPDKPKLAQTDKATAKKELKHELTFDLNTADSIQFLVIKGIGPKLASRIIKFRNSLGGFVNKEQLREIYGLDSTVIKSLSVSSFIRENFQPKKMNMNKATESELSAHPYIKKRIAKAIVSYRFQHGDFTDVNQIENLTILKPDEILRLKSYLSTID